MKTRLVVYLGLGLLLAVMAGGGCVLRRDEVNAHRAWRNNPTVETKAELDRQRAITRTLHYKLTAGLFGIMAAFTVPFIVIVSRRNQRPTAQLA